jgi:hypothetical protein
MHQAPLTVGRLIIRTAILSMLMIANEHQSRHRMVGMPLLAATFVAAMSTERSSRNAHVSRVWIAVGVKAAMARLRLR